METWGNTSLLGYATLRIPGVTTIHMYDLAIYCTNKWMVNFLMEGMCLSIDVLASLYGNFDMLDLGRSRSIRVVS